MKLQVSLRDHTSYRTGGRAKIYFPVKGKKDVLDALDTARRLDEKFFVLGNGSNVLVRDTGFDGVIIHARYLAGGIRISGKHAECSAGEMLQSLVNTLADAGYCGFEFLAGIPGTVGGAIFMNAGAYGGSFLELVDEVTFVTADGVIERAGGSDLVFGYRTQKIVPPGAIILSCRVRLSTGDSIGTRRRIGEMLESRRNKQPLEYPSCGSVFRNPVSKGQYAWQLIDSVGMRGYRHGGAMVSEKHPNFIVNVDDASASDVLEIIKLIKKKVYEGHRIRLKEEVVIL